MKKVLLIEPNLASQQVIKEKLKQANFNVVATSSARDAIKITLSEKFDLLIMDIGTPDAYGIDISEHIGCPIMIMKASKNLSSKPNKSKNGIVFLQKPLNVLDNLPLILKTIESGAISKQEKSNEKMPNQKKETFQIAIGCLIADQKISQTDAKKRIISMANDKNVCKYLIAENILKKYEKK